MEKLTQKQLDQIRAKNEKPMDYIAMTREKGVLKKII